MPRQRTIRYQVFNSATPSHAAEGATSSPSEQRANRRVHWSPCQHRAAKVAQNKKRAGTLERSRTNCGQREFAHRGFQRTNLEVYLAQTHSSTGASSEKVRDAKFDDGKKRTADLFISSLDRRPLHDVIRRRRRLRETSQVEHQIIIIL